MLRLAVFLVVGALLSASAQAQTWSEFVSGLTLGTPAGGDRIPYVRSAGNVFATTAAGLTEYS
jgi:hypothetical protein